MEGKEKLKAYPTAWDLGMGHGVGRVYRSCIRGARDGGIGPRTLEAQASEVTTASSTLESLSDSPVEMMEAGTRNLDSAVVNHLTSPVHVHHMGNFFNG